ALARSLHAPDGRGALVSSVQPDSPASQAGLKPGDVIVEYDGRPVGRTEELPRAVADTPVGRTVSIRVLRDGRPLTLTARIAKLAESDETRMAAAGPGAPGLGLTVESLTPQVAEQLGVPDRRGAVVRDVADGSRAAGAGLRPGDVIVEADRHSIGSAADLRRTLVRH